MRSPNAVSEFLTRSSECCAYFSYFCEWVLYLALATSGRKGGLFVLWNDLISFVDHMSYSCVLDMEVQRVGYDIYACAVIDLAGSQYGYPRGTSRFFFFVTRICTACGSYNFEFVQHITLTMLPLHNMIIAVNVCSVQHIALTMLRLYSTLQSQCGLYAPSYCTHNVHFLQYHYCSHNVDSVQHTAITMLNSYSI